MHHPRRAMIPRFNELHEFFDPFTWIKENNNHAEWRPHIDIQDQTNQYLISADLPGIDPKQIKLQMKNNILTIQGERKAATEEIAKNFVKKERFEGYFIRDIEFPQNVDKEHIKAKSKNGVLEITVPKTGKSPSVDIEIEA